MDSGGVSRGRSHLCFKQAQPKMFHSSKVEDVVENVIFGISCTICLRTLNCNISKLSRKIYSVFFRKLNVSDNSENYLLVLSITNFYSDFFC